MRFMKKSKKYALIIVLVLVVLILYNVIDNNRIRVVEDVVSIKNLPSNFEGFTILHITDLHGKEFGKNQSKLTYKINNIDYDMIAITGDMKDIHSDNIDPFLDIMKNINNKEYIFYVPGNTDLDSFNEEIEASGVNILEKTYEINRDGQVIEIDKLDVTKVEDDSDKVRIGLFHYPMTLDDYNKDEYDLILSGHYHGGQVRVPFYGALFIPHVNGGKFFPSQDEVSGLKDYKLFKQYTSRGLGANSAWKLLKFRLFNTPEINVIRLVNDEK